MENPNQNFDMNVAIEFLRRQRNEALDQCAIVAAQGAMLAKENGELKARVAELIEAQTDAGAIDAKPTPAKND